MVHKRLQWHPPFPNTMGIELWDAADQLEIVGEYPLSEKPLRIDVLIINQRPEVPIRKSIGRIFKRYNIVEYKSPEDYVSVNDYYKVFAYSGLYQSLTERVLEVSPDEMTVTFVSNHFPRGLFRHLKERYGVSIERPFEGIYYLIGLMFPTQLDIIEPLALAYKGHERDPMYAAVMDLIMRANSKVYEEAKDMCDALRELFADELEAKWVEGKGIGKTEGKAQLNKLTKLLIQAGRIDDVRRGTEDSKYQEMLLREHGLW